MLKRICSGSYLDFGFSLKHVSSCLCWTVCIHPLSQMLRPPSYVSVPFLIHLSAFTLWCYLIVIFDLLHKLNSCSPPPSLLLFSAPPLCPSAGTQTGEEIPIVSRSNIKEFKDSFSNENFDFRNSPNITFFVYVSNFTWPIKIQVSFAAAKQINSQVPLI